MRVPLSIQNEMDGRLGDGLQLSSTHYFWLRMRIWFWLVIFVTCPDPLAVLANKLKHEHAIANTDALRRFSICHGVLLVGESR